MNLVAIAVTVYGVLCLLGGVIGYVRAKSKISLASGLLSGILLLIAASLLIQERELGLIIARIITFLLLIVFVRRLIETKKLMPAGLMLVAGTITLILLFS
jgi:uncharacterized membrane protein (UPF0136 family)